MADATPHARLVTFRAAPGAEQATIPAPDGAHRRDHQGRHPSTCRMGEAEYHAWRTEVGDLVEILSEEALMKYRVTLAEGEGFVTIPWPRSSDRVAGGRTKLREDRPVVLEMSEQDMVNLEKTYKGRVRFERVEESTPADGSGLSHDDAATAAAKSAEAAGQRLRNPKRGTQPSAPADEGKPKGKPKGKKKTS